MHDFVGYLARKELKGVAGLPCITYGCLVESFLLVSSFSDG